MQYEALIPLGYVIAVAVKVLAPPHPHSKILQLCLAEAELLTNMVPCPRFEPKAERLKPSQFMFMEERKSHGPACRPDVSSPTAAVALEVYG